MGLTNGIYAKIWSAKPRGKTFSCQTSVSKKSETGEYETLFNGYVSFAGKAAEKIATLNLPETSDRNDPKYKSVRIAASPNIGYWYDKRRVDNLVQIVNKAQGISEEERKSLIRYIYDRGDIKPITIWDIDLDNNGSQKSAKSTKSKKPEPEVEDDEDSDLPF